MQMQIQYLHQSRDWYGLYVTTNTIIFFASSLRTCLGLYLLLMTTSPSSKSSRDSDDGSVGVLQSTIDRLRSDDLFEQERSLRILINLTAQKCKHHNFLSSLARAHYFSQCRRET